MPPQSCPYSQLSPPTDQGKSNACCVSECLVQCQAFLVQRFCSISVMFEVNQQICSRHEHLHLRRCCTSFALGSRPFEETPPLTPVSTDFPVPQQCSSQAQSHLSPLCGPFLLCQP